MANAAGPAPETTGGRAEKKSSPARKSEILSRLGYTEISDAASNREIARLFTTEFPKVLAGSRTNNPAELNPAARAKIPPPEYRTLQTPEGERLWALSFGDRLTLVLGAGTEPIMKSDVDDTIKGRVFPIKNLLIGSTIGGDAAPMVDLVPYLHRYEQRKGVKPTELYLTLGYMDPYYFSGDTTEDPYVLLPLSLGTHGDTRFVDPDKTASVAIHEGSHAARRQIDAKREENAGGANEDTRKAAEYGAHRAGRFLVHQLRRYVDPRVYRRFMASSLESYRVLRDGPVSSPSRASQI